MSASSIATGARRADGDGAAGWISCSPLADGGALGNCVCDDPVAPTPLAGGWIGSDGDWVVFGSDVAPVGSEADCVTSNWFPGDRVAVEVAGDGAGEDCIWMGWLDDDGVI
ncbi:MAG: hypothetical protein JO352_10745 [Chloroflexi bacterium]|nr:hypothetical protein [Chloroflexota bacterium]